MIWRSVNSSSSYILSVQLIITVGLIASVLQNTIGTLFTVAGLPSPQTGSTYGGGQPQAGGLPQQQQQQTPPQQSTPLPPPVIPGGGVPGSGTAIFPANANSQGSVGGGGAQMPSGSQFTVGVGGVRRNYAGWREWRRADPTLINTLWRNKMGNGIRKQLGNAEVYIMLALLIGLATVVIGCWLSDNCWSPEPEHVVTLA